MVILYKKKKSEFSIKSINIKNRLKHTFVLWAQELHSVNRYFMTYLEMLPLSRVKMFFYVKLAAQNFAEARKLTFMVKVKEHSKMFK